MNIRFKISTVGFISSFSDSKLKKLDKLQRSVNSTNKDNADFSWESCVSSQDFKFNHEEIHSALKRLKKNENELSVLLADIDFDKFVENKPFYSSPLINNDESFVVSLIKAILGFVIPSVYYDERYAHYETGGDWPITYMTVDLKEEVLAELYYRRAIRIFSNILSKFFEFRNLITAESPIKRIKYKYFDLIFSLKKEVALKTPLITQFFNELFYCRENEKTYFGNIQTAGRT